MDVNDGIVAAAGVAEGVAAAGAPYTETRTEWELNRALVEAEKASISAR